MHNKNKAIIKQSDPVHLTCFDTVLKREAYELKRFLKYAALANCRLALTENQLIDNACFLDFYGNIGQEPGAREFLIDLFESGSLIIAKSPNFASFESALIHRIYRSTSERKFIFSALSKNDNTWIKRNKPSIDEFYARFPRYQPWIDFLDSQNKLATISYNFSTSNFPELTKERYCLLQDNVTDDVKRIFEGFLENHSVFSRSQIYHYIDNVCVNDNLHLSRPIKRILIDDLYNYNLCSSCNMKMLLQQIDNNLLNSIFRDVNKYEFQSEFIDVHDYFLIDNFIDCLELLSFEDICSIRKNIYNSIIELEAGNTTQYQNILFDEVKKKMLSQGNKSFVISHPGKAIKAFHYTVESALALSVIHLAGYLGAILTGNAIPHWSWPEYLFATGALSSGKFGFNLIYDKLTAREISAWINFKQNLSGAIKEMHH